MPKSTGAAIRAAMLSAVLAPGAAHSLDLAGKVVDKRFAPIAAVQVCETAAPLHCAVTASDGKFRLQGNVGLVAPLGFEIGPAAAYRYGVDGRSNGAPHASGIHFAWPGPGIASAPVARGVGAAGPGSAKTAAAAPGLTCSKDGYATTTFQAAADTGSNLVIVMGGAGEKVTALFTGASLAGWTQIPAASWVLKDGALASTGAGRGVAYAGPDALDFRVIFSVRQVSGDHWPCVLYFTERPPAGQKGLDALGGVQWQAPSVNTWDYRPGKNNSGNDFYTKVNNPNLNRNQWAQCEIVAHGSTGTARMGCCQVSATGPCKAVEILRFKDAAAAGRKGPFALQMHNAGIHDEYKDISIESDPKDDSLFLAR